MTERKQSALSRSADHLQIGPSSLRWDKDTLVINFDEISAPLPFPVRGEVRLTPTCAVAEPINLDNAGHHQWWPLAPQARVEVRCSKPDLSWHGTGYLDTNAGNASLESGFDSWDWCRAPFDDGAAVLYNVVPKGQTEQALALWISDNGDVTEFTPPPRHHLPTSLWRVPRPTRADAGTSVRIHRSLEDTPFYTRSLIETSIRDRRVQAVHESLSLRRFASPVVKAMLPFRMPRNFWS